MNEVAQRYGLNAFFFVMGPSDAGYHAFNMFFHGDGFKLWEPNDGFPHSGQILEIGDYGYIPEEAIA